MAFSFSRRYRFALLMVIYTYPSAIHLGAKFDFHWALPLFFGVFQYVVLQVGQILGVPGLRGYHVSPHCRYLCSLITFMS